MPSNINFLFIKYNFYIGSLLELPLYFGLLVLYLGFNIVKNMCGLQPVGICRIIFFCCHVFICFYFFLGAVDAKPANLTVPNLQNLVLTQQIKCKFFKYVFSEKIKSFQNISFYLTFKKKKLLFSYHQSIYNWTASFRC